ncbi:hypothetical protein H1R20_g12520, partial [Candolleomyces eurysporus]
MITYLADCGNVPCSEFDSTKARWFKIHQVGKKPNGGEWFQADLMQGGKVSAKLPENIRQRQRQLGIVLWPQEDLQAQEEREQLRCRRCFHRGGLPPPYQPYYAQVGV